MGKRSEVAEETLYGTTDFSKREESNRHPKEVWVLES
jgi:hypothetical protein